MNINKLNMVNLLCFLKFQKYMRENANVIRLKTVYYIWNMKKIKMILKMIALSIIMLILKVFKKIIFIKK